MSCASMGSQLGSDKIFQGCWNPIAIQFLRIFVTLCFSANLTIGLSQADTIGFQENGTYPGTQLTVLRQAGVAAIIIGIDCRVWIVTRRWGAQIGDRRSTADRITNVNMHNPFLCTLCWRMRSTTWANVNPNHSVACCIHVRLVAHNCSSNELMKASGSLRTSDLSFANIIGGQCIEASIGMCICLSTHAFMFWEYMLFPMWGLLQGGEFKHKTSSSAPWRASSLESSFVVTRGCTDRMS